MSAFNITWPASFTDLTGLIAQAIAAAANVVSSAIIDNNNKLSTEVTVSITYGGTAAGATIYILRDIDGTNFEAIATDRPEAFVAPGVASSTVRVVFTVQADQASRFKVAVANPTGNSSITVTARYKQATGVY